MKRCIETADILYPGKVPILVPQWKEMDFGLFEGKNYQELNGDKQYQAWIDSGGTLPFRRGKAGPAFCRDAVRECMSRWTDIGNFLPAESKIGCVVHGRNNYGTFKYVLWRGIFWLSGKKWKGLLLYAVFAERQNIFYGAEKIMIYHIIAFVCGFLIDLILGDPYCFPHPIRLIGKLISWLELTFKKLENMTEKRQYTGHSCACGDNRCDGISVSPVLPDSSISRSTGWNHYDIPDTGNKMSAGRKHESVP